VVQGTAPVGGLWGTKSPETEAFGTFAHKNFAFLPYARFFRRSNGGRTGHGPSGPMVNTLVPHPLSLSFPLQKSGGSGGPPGKN